MVKCPSEFQMDISQIHVRNAAALTSLLGGGGGGGGGD
jgi:hypothetical protein